MRFMKGRLAQQLPEMNRPVCVRLRGGQWARNHEDDDSWAAAMRRKALFYGNEPVSLAAHAPPQDDDLHLRHRRVIWVVERHWMRSKEMSCSALTAGGTAKQFGYNADGSMLLETNDAIASRKRGIAALCEKCSCKTGCTGRCGCARRGRACNDGCFCQRSGRQCSSNPSSPFGVVEFQDLDSNAPEESDASDADELESTGFDERELEGLDELAFQEAEALDALGEEPFAASAATIEEEETLSPINPFL